MELRTGKAGANVLSRAVEKRLGKAMERGVPAAGERIMASDPVTLCTRDVGTIAVISAVNGLSARGAAADRIETVILLPVGSQEQELREIEDQIEGCARNLSLLVSGGHTEVTAAVTRPLVCVTASGTVWERERTGKEEGPLSLIAAGWLGAEGTYLLAREKREEILQRFPLSIESRALSFGKELCIQRAAKILWKEGAPILQNASEGGIFAGLYAISEKAGKEVKLPGFRVDLASLPIRQETIELTDYFGINPYEMESAGCLLAAVRDAAAACRTLRNEGIHAVKIGELTAGKGRILTNRGEERFLDLPAPDSLIPLLG